MSLHYEQVRSLEMARDLLSDLINKPQQTMIRSIIRQRAAVALKHFPTITIEGVILWSKDTLPPTDTPIANSEQSKG